MPYHKPPELTWDAALLSHALNSRGLEATPADCAVRIIQTVTDEDLLDKTVDIDEPESQERLKTRERNLEINGWKTGQYQSEIKYHPERLLHNISVESEHGMPWRALFEIHRLAGQALKEVGCLPLNKTTESEIAHLHCNDTEVVNELLDEIQRLRAIKERCVEDQEFEKAAQTHHEETVVRNSLDDLLKQSAG